MQKLKLQKSINYSIKKRRLRRPVKNIKPDDHLEMTEMDMDEIRTEVDAPKAEAKNNS